MNFFELEFPAESVAVHVTVVVPTRKSEPDAGLQLTVGAGSTRSVAVAVYVTFTPPARDAFTVIPDGTLSDGGVVSCTSTSKLAVLVLPALSVAEQLTVVCPSRNVEPDAAEHATGSVPSAASVAVTV